MSPPPPPFKLFAPPWLHLCIVLDSIEIGIRAPSTSLPLVCSWFGRCRHVRTAAAWGPILWAADGPATPVISKAGLVLLKWSVENKDALTVRYLLYALVWSALPQFAIFAAPSAPVNRLPTAAFPLHAVALLIVVLCSSLLFGASVRRTSGCSPSPPSNAGDALCLCSHTRGFICASCLTALRLVFVPHRLLCRLFVHGLEDAAMCELLLLGGQSCGLPTALQRP